MSKFKVGDTVRRIKGSHAGMNVGDTAIVTKADGVTITLGGYKSEHDAHNFELAEPQFDMKTSPWFIQVHTLEQYAAVQGWLKINYGDKLRCTPPLPCIITNANPAGEVRSHILGWHNLELAVEGKEIKFKFKFELTIKSVTYPKVETEQQRKIRELQETIEKAQKQIADLQQGV